MSQVFCKVYQSTPTCNHNTMALKCFMLRMSDMTFHKMFYATKNKIDQDNFISRNIAVNPVGCKRPKNEKHKNHHFENVSGDVIATLVRNNPEDALIAVKSVQFLQSEKQLMEFLRKLANVPLSDDVQTVLAECVVQWFPDADKEWTFDRFNIIKRVGSPLLAYLPIDFLYNLSKSSANKFLFYMKDWKETTMDSFSMKDMPWGVRRAWTNLLLQEKFSQPLQNWTRSHISRFGFLLSGATADELLLLPALESSMELINETSLNKLQVRSLFNHLLPNLEMTPNLDRVLGVSLLLAPLDLQRFPMSTTNFMLLHNLPLQMGDPSLPTAKQVVELLIAQLVVENILHNESSSTWGENIEYLGKYVFALSRAALEPYASASLPVSILAAVDTEKLSVEQSKQLIGYNDYKNILQLRGLLQGINSSHLCALQAGELPEKLLDHLLTSLPSGSSIRSLCVLQKVRKHLGANNILNILLNKNSNQFFGLLSSSEVSSNMKEIMTFFTTLPENLQSSVKDLPPVMLSVFLSNTREKLARSGHLWTSARLQSPGLNLTVLGMTCNDIAAIDTVDTVRILETYNKERKTLHKLFPKHLQYCWQNAILIFLSMKKQLRQVDESALLDLLEPLEIKAFGGYVFASLPLYAVAESINSVYILKTIGMLSIPELLVATSGTHPHEYARTMIEKLHSVGESPQIIGLHDLVSLGNLVFFIDIPDINKVDPVSFKYFVECLDSRYKTICADTETRASWNRLILQAFGAPHNWTAATVATLGDLLVALPSAGLDMIPKDSWIVAADTLTEQTSYHVAMNWPGENNELTYVQVCLKLLPEFGHEDYFSSVHNTVRRFLLATQDLLKTIVPATELLAHTPKVLSKKLPDLRHSSIHLGHALPEIEVLEPEEVTESAAIKELHSEEANATDQTTIPPEAIDNRLKRELSNDKVSETGEILRESLKRASDIQQEARANGETTSSNKRFLENETISCDAIKAAGLSSGLAIRAMDIDVMTVDGLLDCIETFGLLDLPQDVTQSIWTFIHEEKLQIDWAIAGHLLKDITIGIVDEMDLNLTAPATLDLLAALGAEITNGTMLQYILHKFLTENSNTSWSTEVIYAMGHLICKLSPPFLQTILGKENYFVESSPIFAKVSGDPCSVVCLQQLANIAVKHTSYGNPGLWTAEDVETLGAIAAGLQADKMLLLDTNKSNNPIVGLQPSAIACMPSEVFKVLSDSQIQSLSPMAAAMVTAEQKSLLSKTQMSSLTAVLNQEPMVGLSAVFTIEEDVVDGGASLISNLCLILGLFLFTSVIECFTCV